MQESQARAVVLVKFLLSAQVLPSQEIILHLHLPVATIFQLLMAAEAWEGFQTQHNITRFKLQ